MMWGRQMDTLIPLWFIHTYLSRTYNHGQQFLYVHNNNNNDQNILNTTEYSQTQQLDALNGLLQKLQNCTGNELLFVIKQLNFIENIMNKYEATQKGEHKEILQQILSQLKKLAQQMQEPQEFGADIRVFKQLISTYEIDQADQLQRNLNNTQQYDESGVREVFDSSADPEIRKLRNDWLAIPLRDKIRWNQSQNEVYVSFDLPSGSRKSDVMVEIKHDWLSLKLKWAGKVLDGQLYRTVKNGESCWMLDGSELQIMLPKDSNDVWKALFKEGEERSYVELLKELVDADEGVRKEELDFESQLLLEEMRERQELISKGELDIEGGFDDFRIVLGQNSLTYS
eukprot:TRINITY_DN10175_c0_g1_i1.p1 TRINITY_DN10175_c0_g1~~TRINITY_DN10175_c0_g1_i1.p1  ORF type:complete len:341 (+),score=52.95 TRINITY_DN10175_c0_g1_i1:78-1100(+)